MNVIVLTADAGERISVVGTGGETDPRETTTRKETTQGRLLSSEASSKLIIYSQATPDI